MAWALRQSKTAFDDGAGHVDQAATFDSAVAAGSLIVVTLTWAQGLTSCNLTCTGPDTFTKDQQVDQGSGDGYAMAKFHAYNATAGSYTVTGHNDQSQTFSRIIIEEFTGALMASDPFDKNAGQRQGSPGTGTDAVTSGTAITTTSGQLIHGSTVNVLALSTITKGTGFTDGAGVNYHGVSTEYLTQTSAGSVAATFTIAVDNVQYTIMTTFKVLTASSPMFRGS